MSSKPVGLVSAGNALIEKLWELPEIDGEPGRMAALDLLGNMFQECTDGDDLREKFYSEMGGDSGITNFV